MIATNRVFIGTATGHIYNVDVKNGTTKALPVEPHHWMQLGTDGSKIMAIGRSKNENLAIIHMDSNGNKLGQHVIDNSYLASFCWITSNGSVYIASNNRVATFVADELSQIPSTVSLPAEQTDYGMLALYNDLGQTRLLLKRHDGSLHSLLLVDPETGAQVAVGGVLQASPVICPAGQYIVAATREGTGMKLCTYAFSEGV